MTRVEIAALVAQARISLLAGALDAVVADTGGAGLCYDVSLELAAWLRARGFDARCFWVAIDHCAVQAGGWIVDITAQQFNPRAAYPKIVRLSALPECDERRGFVEAVSRLSGMSEHEVRRLLLRHAQGRGQPQLLDAYAACSRQAATRKVARLLDGSPAMA